MKTLLFVCLGIFFPLENSSFIWRCHHYRWRVTIFGLYSALMAIEQWGFLSVPHLLWHGPTLYNGHLWGSLTLTPVAERLAVKLSLPVLLTWLNSDLPHARLSHRSGSYLDDNCFVRWPVESARGYTPPYLSRPEVEHFYCGGTLRMPAPLRQPTTWSKAQWWQTRGNLKQRTSSSMSYMCQLDVKTIGNILHRCYWK